MSIDTTGASTTPAEPSTAGGTAPLEPPAAVRGSTFRSLYARNYRWFFAGQIVSQAGTWMQNLAIGWLTLQLSHSGLVLGAMTAARFVPLILLGPLGGLISDRSENRRLLTQTQAVMGVVSLVLAILAAVGRLNLPILFVLVVALGIVGVFDMPARQTLIPQLVRHEDLPNAVALNSIAMNLSRIVGPSLGGIVMASLGAAPCFFINAGSFVFVIATMLVLRPDQMFVTPPIKKSKGQIRAGIVHIRDNPELLYPMILITITGILTWEFPVSLPLLVTGAFHGDARAYGVATSVMGIGAVFGGLLAARRARISTMTLAVSAALWGVMISAAALAPSLLTLCLLLVVVGSGSITFNSMAKTLLQMNADPQYRGRVMSLWSIVWSGGTVPGAVIIGAIGALAGGRWAFLTNGIAAVLAAAAVALARSRAGRPRKERPSETLVVDAADIE